MLAGKTALVTGANGAIGSEISRTLAREGAHVIVNYFEDRASAEALASSIGGTAIYADIGDSSDVEKMLAGFPRIDILVNNTGVQTFGPLLDVLETDWDRVIRTNEVIVHPLPATGGVVPALAGAVFDAQGNPPSAITASLSATLRCPV